MCVHACTLTLAYIYVSGQPVGFNSLSYYMGLNTGDGLTVNTFAADLFWEVGGDWMMCRLTLNSLYIKSNLELLILLPAEITDVCHQAWP